MHRYTVQRAVRVGCWATSLKMLSLCSNRSCSLPGDPPKTATNGETVQPQQLALNWASKFMLGLFYIHVREKSPSCRAVVRLQHWWLYSCAQSCSKPLSFVSQLLACKKNDLNGCFSWQFLTREYGRSLSIRTSIRLVFLSARKSEPFLGIPNFQSQARPIFLRFNPVSNEWNKSQWT